VKEVSFESARGYFDNSSFEIVDKFSSIRKDWPEYEGRSYMLNNVPEWVRERLGEDWFREVYEFTQEVFRRATAIRNA